MTATLDDRGSFLLETMISLVVLSIMMIAFAQSFDKASGSIKSIGDEGSLLKLAQAEMERLKALGFNNNVAGENGLSLTAPNNNAVHTKTVNPIVLDGVNHRVDYNWEVTGITAAGGETLCCNFDNNVIYRRIDLTATLDQKTDRVITLNTLIGDN